MKWDEFCSLLKGLSADSPLGRIVQIRSENDPKILKNFTKYQRKIRSDWRNKKVKQITPKNRDEMLEQMKQMFISMT